MRKDLGLLAGAGSRHSVLCLLPALISEGTLSFRINHPLQQKKTLYNIRHIHTRVYVNTDDILHSCGLRSEGAVRACVAASSRHNKGVAGVAGVAGVGYIFVAGVGDI